ncbi:MAG: acylphosphatase [Bacteroidetes bacterium]|nr:acylphosphatase [Bacteroidota bacterium]
MTQRSVILHIHGRVQNVGFRYYTQKKALSLNIKGFVKNLPDGSVYVEAQGEPSNIEDFIAFCRQGPDWARVDDLSIQDTPAEDFEGFHIR